MIVDGNNGFSIRTEGDREIVLTRSFAAPPELVFTAWTTPAHVRQWWGCAQFRLTVCEVDLRPGGAWEYVMSTPGGGEYRFHGVYQEIERPGRLVYTECYADPSCGNPEWLTTVTFEERGGKTWLTSHILHGSQESRDGHLKSGMESGVVETYNRLEQLLGELAVRT